MTRKTASFGQLVKYINKGAGKFNSFEAFHKNIYGREAEEIIKEFEKNGEDLPKRKNGNMLYHEVISITRSPDLSLEEQKKILYGIVKDYTELRAKNNLVYGRMHLDNPDNLHFHLIISSNELGSTKRHRLKKATFSNIQKEIEKHVLNNHPELNQKIIYNQNKSEKTKSREYELKRRTGKESQRDRVKRELKGIFSTSNNKADFFTMLQNKGYEIYIRGNSIGVTWKETGKNYRLKTLGLESDFKVISNKFEEVYHRKEEVKEARKENKKEQNFNKEKIQSRTYRGSAQENKKEPEPAKDPKQAEIDRRKQEMRKEREATKQKNKDYNPDNDFKY